MPAGRCRGHDANLHRYGEEGLGRLLHEASQMGVTIAPPVPAFYNRPQTIDDIINHTAARVLDLFDLDTGTVNRWQGIAGEK